MKEPELIFSGFSNRTSVDVFRGLEESNFITLQRVEYRIDGQLLAFSTPQNIRCYHASANARICADSGAAKLFGNFTINAFQYKLDITVIEVLLPILSEDGQEFSDAFWKNVAQIIFRSMGMEYLAMSFEETGVVEYFPVPVKVPDFFVIFKQNKSIRILNFSRKNQNAEEVISNITSEIAINLRLY